MESFDVIDTKMMDSELRVQVDLVGGVDARLEMEIARETFYIRETRNAFFNGVDQITPFALFDEETQVDRIRQIDVRKSEDVNKLARNLLEAR